MTALWSVLAVIFVLVPMLLTAMLWAERREAPVRTPGRLIPFPKHYPARRAKV
jgi:hypothetical protein